MKLSDLASKIRSHLRRLETDSGVNVLNDDGMPRYHKATANEKGRGVKVSYVSYGPPHSLDREAAEAYLRRLDAGHTSTHLDCD
jgi:hypothetical protein